MGSTQLIDETVRHEGAQVGDTIDARYELRRDLGRGAAGLVFEARHLFTNRSVALKMIGPDVPKGQRGELRARLVREARALAAVRHPGIVEVLDGGVLADGTPYIVMDKLEGRTLEGLLATRGKFSREDTIALGLQLCDALDAAHKAGVVHRDLKPGNIFIVRDRDGEERTMLVDFGIAQVGGSQEEKLTGIGALIGTPGYMAPEQLLALDGVDGRADLYALGITLFECFTGKVPYEGNYQRVLLQACGDSPQPSLLEACPSAGAEIAAVVERCFSRKPEARYANALEVARALSKAAPSIPHRTYFLGPRPPPKFGAPSATPSPTIPAGQQRRRTPRAPYATPVRLVVSDGSIDGRSEDISDGGLLMICREPCPANVRATVRFALPIEGLVVSVEAQVRWVRAARADAEDGPRAVGIEFVDPQPEMRASIARYVELMGGDETTS